MNVMEHYDVYPLMSPYAVLREQIVAQRGNHLYIRHKIADLG